MVHGVSGRQVPTQSKKTSPPKVEEQAFIKDGLEIKNSLCIQNSMQLPPKEEKLCSELASLSCLSFRGRNLSPQKKFTKLKVHCSSPCRSRCLDFCNAGARGFSVLSFNVKGSTRKSRTQIKGANAGIAWMTVPGLLVDADDVISGGIVKLTGHRETIAWNGFAPLQKVLVLAVTAAAATAAKQKYSKEMRNLQRALNVKDKDLENLRGKIGQLQEHLSFWKEQAQNLCVEAKESGATDKVFLTENASPLLKFGLASTSKCDAVMLDTPQIGNGLEKMLERVACFRKNTRAASFRKSSYRFGSTMSKERPDVDNHHEIRTFLDRLSESTSSNGGQFYASTPELSLTKLSMIDTPQLSFNNVFPQQVDYVNRYFQKGCRNMAEDSSISPVPGTELILQLKGQLSTSEETNDKTVCVQKDADNTMVSNLGCTKDQEDQTKVGSAVVQLVVNSTVDTLLTPLCGGNSSDNDGWSSEVVIEQLLLELESAAAKVASMEAQISFLKETELRKEGFTTILDKSTCHTCQEFDSKVRLLEDAEKKLATCREACKKKEKAITRLENENVTLQEMVSELRSIQVTPKVVTSNMLFNLDSPIKMDSPQRAKSPFCSWRHLDEVSRESSFLERNSMKGSCDSDIYKSGSGNYVPPTEGYSNDSDGLQAAAMYRPADDNDHTPHTEGYKNESICMLQAYNLIQRNSMKGSCDSDMYRSESSNYVPPTEGDSNESGCGLQAAAMYSSADGNDHMPRTEGYKNESGCMLQAARAIGCNNITFRRGNAKDYGIDRSGEEEVSSRNSSSTDDLVRKSGTSSTRSSSDNSSSGSVVNARLPCPPRSYSGHARKLKFTNATDLRFSDESGRSQTAGGRRQDAGGSILNSKASNVLAGVEPNTPLRDRKLSNGSKEKFWGHSLDSLSKAKENFTQRRRWM